MPRVNSLDTIWSRTSLAAEDGDRSLLNAARRLRMLRELGCPSHPLVDSYGTRDSDRSTRNPRLLFPPDHRKASEEVNTQLEVERRLHAEARRLAEAIKAWEEAETTTRVEIEFSVQAERNPREAAEAGPAIEREAPKEAEHRAEEVIDIAGRAHAEAITQTLAEMMMRVQAEQKAITEMRVRAAAEDCAKYETVELVTEKRGVLYKVFFHSRNRLAH